MEEEGMLHRFLINWEWEGKGNDADKNQQIISYHCWIESCYRRANYQTLLLFLVTDSMPKDPFAYGNFKWRVKNHIQMKKKYRFKI